jgi:type II secretory pathway pseudopilin PulG
MGHSSRGAALIDVIVTCGLVAVLCAIAIPTLQATRDRDAARSAARYLANRLHLTRIEAVRRNTNVSLRFDPDDLGRIRLFADGNGDGVRQVDIDGGIDPALGPDADIEELFPNVSLQIVATVREPDATGTLDAGSDPVRIGASSLLSFSPLGSATSGTIYLAARTGPQLCVRVLGATGRTRVLWFDTANRTWRQD